MSGRVLSGWVTGLSVIIAAVADGATVTSVYTNPPTATVGTALADPGGGDILAVQVHSGEVEFTGANTYSAGTEILGSARFMANSTSPLGSGNVTVRNGGMLRFNQSTLQGRTLSNSLYLNDGAGMQNLGGPWNAETTFEESGNIYLGGSVNIMVGSSGQTFSILKLSGTVQNDGAGTGSLVVTGSNSWSGGTYSGQRYLQLYGANTYSGGTTLADHGYVQVWHNNALGSGAVTVQSNGVLYLCSGVTVTNNITFQGGSQLMSRNGGEGINGTITVNGALRMYSGIAASGDSAILNLNPGGGRITGPGGLALYRGYWMSYDLFSIYGTNDYEGATLINANTRVTAFNANALGTNAGNAVTIDGSGAMLSIATEPLHINKSICCTNGGEFFQAVAGTTASNAVTLANGAYSFVSSGSTYHRGAFTLVAGTVNQFRSGPWANNGNWYQDGTMAGSGALTFDAAYMGNASRHLRGNNSAYSGTIYSPIVNKCYVGSDNGLGTGMFVLQGTTLASRMLILDTSVSLANGFQGTGTVDTTTYTLTHTGILDPGPAGAIGTLAFASTGAGNLDFRGTYNLHYDAATNDLVTATALTFGNVGGQAAMTVSWVGGGLAPTPPDGGATYVVFTYTGTDPTITTPWTVTCPSGLRGVLSVDSGARRVLLNLSVIPMPGAVFRFR